MVNISSLNIKRKEIIVLLTSECLPAYEIPYLLFLTISEDIYPGKGQNLVTVEMAATNIAFL